MNLKCGQQIQNNGSVSLSQCIIANVIQMKHMAHSKHFHYYIQRSRGLPVITDFSSFFKMTTLSLIVVFVWSKKALSHFSHHVIFPGFLTLLQLPNRGLGMTRRYFTIFEKTSVERELGTSFETPRHHPNLTGFNRQMCKFRI